MTKTSEPRVRTIPMLLVAAVTVAAAYAFGRFRDGGSTDFVVAVVAGLIAGVVALRWAKGKGRPDRT